MSIPDYDFQSVEARWQTRWAELALFDTPSEKGGERYVLAMYPYPSGALHMGHVFNYTISDAIVRYHVMRGAGVLTPMGWDSFGLPAENHAIKTGIHPSQSTERSIAAMRDQIIRAGWAYDWSKELATSHPDYYRWTQWLFLRLFEAGKAFRKKAPVNWCPSCNTVLANEQVHDGTCERCGTEVDQRDLVQWFFNLSDYAQHLLDGHDALAGNWPERVLKMQRDWIGRSDGARLDFTLEAPGCDLDGATLSVFTTRPDTTFGVTFMSLAPEHPWIEPLVAGTERESEVLEAVRVMRRQSHIERTSEESEKVGVFTGRHVINPFDGSRAQLWVANYALMEYGTGAVMAVPAHDHRDFRFARKYGLPVRVVIQPADVPALVGDDMSEAHVEPGVMVGSGEFDGQPNEKAKRAMTEWVAERDKGDFDINYRLRDWLISRQRYWGCPIPIVLCDVCGDVAVPDNDLPVLLPDDVEFKPTGESPLAASHSFVETTCPRCGGPARREIDTMDTFVDSSWYFLRYPTPELDSAPFDADAVGRWLPVSQYVGGIEHATMHLIYARYFTMALRDLGLLSFSEPFERLFCQGMISAMAYRCPEHTWVPVEEVDLDTLTHRECGHAVQAELAKMSKTKKNGVSPDQLFATYGADSTRMAVLFMGPPDQDIEYSPNTLKGVDNFLKRRLWPRVLERVEAAGDAAPYTGPAAEVDEPWKELRQKAHQILERVADAFESRTFTFNTCIAGTMEVVNALHDAGLPTDGDEVGREVVREVIEIVVKLVAPFAPHIAEELWSTLGGDDSVFRAGWPRLDKEAARGQEVQVVIQVNGKLRDTVEVPRGMGRDALTAMVLEREAVKSRTDGKSVRRVIVVPDRLVNVVVG